MQHPEACKDGSLVQDRRAESSDFCDQIEVTRPPPRLQSESHTEESLDSVVVVNPKKLLVAEAVAVLENLLANSEPRDPEFVPVSKNARIKAKSRGRCQDQACQGGAVPTLPANEGNCAPIFHASLSQCYFAAKWQNLTEVQSIDMSQSAAES